MDYQYIEDLRAIEDKKEAKDKLVAYAEQFGIKVKKTRSFENIVLDIEAGLKELAAEPLPEDNEGLSISDLIDADDELEGKKDFIINDEDTVKEEAKLLFGDTHQAEVHEIKVPEVKHSEPAVDDTVVADVVIESPVDSITEVVSQTIEPEAKTPEMFELPENYSPSLIKIGPGGGYCTLPWWIYDWIVSNEDWKSRPHSFPHHYGIDTLLSLIYYIKREGQVRIRETRNSRFFVLN